MISAAGRTAIGARMLRERKIVTRVIINGIKMLREE
jgi:hypothetical protein